MPAGFYFGQINSDMEFSTSFLVKDGVNFRIDGTYSVKANYAESEAQSFFDYNKVLEIPIKETVETIPDEPELETIPDEPELEIIHKIIPEIIDEEINNENIENDIDNTSIISVDTENKNKITKISQIKETKVIHEKNKPQIEIKNNLSVEYMELGKLLNQINLECDSSVFVDMISYYDGMGPALYRLCNFESSLNFFNDSLNDDPINVEILVNKGSTLGKLGDYSKAIFYYDLALEIDSDFLPAKNNKANALATLGNLDDAILLYEKILDENLNSITIQRNLETAKSLQPDSENEIHTLENNLNKKNLETSFFEKTQSINLQKPVNFFEQINSAFTSLSMFFGFS